ncbi:2OG-Fe(II) oxygenase [Sandarakinorhabdus sp.]|uniref:prolyl hydroxylase family protein n=1 Tax=Sandarakinorhabdus sp. TaxID=1916663 RepID=UPI00286EB4A7|nr:2OG-Fe(II) oxygenase [Sandarakinorhabdus sp.]
MTMFAGAQRLPGNKAELYIAKNFLAAEDCAGLMELIDAGRRPSTITDAYGADAGFRTSETCDLPSENALVDRVRRAIANTAGLPLTHAESLQGQRYAVGQEFKFHTDYFEPGGLDYWEHCTQSGQRTWTVMIYLNTPGAGGATRFRHLDKIIQPETGKLVAWNNRTESGGVNAHTLHAGMPVRAGTKYIITAWFREQPWV